MMLPRRPVVAVALFLTACGSQGAGAEAANADASPVASTAPPPAPVDSPAAAPSASPTAVADQPAGAPTAATDQSGIPLLRTILTKVGRLDGQPITDFKLTAPCTSTISTAARTVTVNWAKVADWAAHDEGARTVVDLDDGTGAHAVSTPSAAQAEPIGNAPARVEGGFSVLADTCAKR